MEPAKQPANQQYNLARTMLNLTTIFPPMNQLPSTKQKLPRHTQKACKTDARRITDCRSSERELAVLLGHTVTNLRKGIDVDQTTEQAFPEDDEEDDIDVRDEVKHGVEGEEHQVEDLKQGRYVEVVNAEERGGGA